MKIFGQSIPQPTIHRGIALTLLGLAITVVISLNVGDSSDQFLSGSPAVTQRFSGIYSEAMLLDFCYQLQNMQGITSVSYREFSPTDQSAVITVYYNPHDISRRQIQVFMHNSRIIWATPLST